MNFVFSWCPTDLECSIHIPWTLTESISNPTIVSSPPHFYPFYHPFYSLGSPLKLKFHFYLIISYKDAVYLYHIHPHHLFLNSTSFRSSHLAYYIFPFQYQIQFNFFTAFLFIEFYIYILIDFIFSSN